MDDELKYTLHETCCGDTFDSLAFAYYDEPLYASKILQANPDYADTLIFDGTVTLKIPVLDDAELPSTLPPWRQ